MKCTEARSQFCRQEGCNAIATCRTKVSGFTVFACKAHHACDIDDKPEAKPKGQRRGE